MIRLEPVRIESGRGKQGLFQGFCRLEGIFREGLLDARVREVGLAFLIVRFNRDKKKKNQIMTPVHLMVQIEAGCDPTVRIEPQAM